MWLIYSYRHRMWWRPDSAGYTPSFGTAGLYTQAEVAQIVTNCLPGQNVPVSPDLAVECGQAAEIETKITQWQRL